MFYFFPLGPAVFSSSVEDFVVFLYRWVLFFWCRSCSVVPFLNYLQSVFFHFVCLTCPRSIITPGVCCSGFMGVSLNACSSVCFLVITGSFSCCPCSLFFLILYSFVSVVFGCLASTFCLTLLNKARFSFTFELPLFPPIYWQQPNNYGCRDFMPDWGLLFFLQRIVKNAQIRNYQSLVKSFMLCNILLVVTYQDSLCAIYAF